ncbi:MAG: WecB/TagA/CpsF family glycosyltransferase [Pseudomonadota bacterium]
MHSKFFNRIDIILDSLTLLQKDEIDSLTQSIFTQNKKIVISFVNFHALNLSWQNDDFCNALLNSNYVLRDGVAIEYLLKGIGKSPGCNLNGADYIPILIKEANKRKRPIVLWGTNNKALLSAKNNLEADGYVVENICNGFELNSHYPTKLESISDNAIIILGMGMPKQEIVSVLLNKKNANYIIINGGAIIDRTSGVIKRAPAKLIKFRLEWLHRFYNEPKRLFRRTIFGGLWFMCYSVFYILKIHVITKFKKLI